MRFDSFGMFWEDAPATTTKTRSQRPMPAIPETGWRAKSVSDLPDLRHCRVISFDSETWDPKLNEAGPGWGRGFGHIVGLSFAAPGVPGFYLPIRHSTRTEENLDPEPVLRYAAAMLDTPTIPKVGANLIYDVGWCAWEGVPVKGMLYDIQFAEALLNSETPQVSLDFLSNKYLGIGKVTSLLYKFISEWTGRGENHPRIREDIHRCPPSLVGPYAEGDAEQPLSILEKQWPLLERRGVLDLFHLECRLIPLLVKMRLKGAPVDIPYAQAFHDELEGELKTIAGQIKEVAGMNVNPNSSTDLRAAFKRNGIPLPIKRGTEDKVTFDAAALEALEGTHPLPDLLLEWRQREKVRGTFVQSYILEANVNGLIHCTFHPLKSDRGGARSGRFASSDPNLQNIPIRTDIGKRVRRAFVARNGARWRKWDYSQIEYRLLAHHAVGPGAEDLRAKFRNNPDIDYHELVQELIRVMAGLELERRPVKTINFGLIYGMSQPELARRLGLTRAAGADLFKSYHRAAPFARATMDEAVKEAERYGSITTLLGRRSDFNLWVGTGWEDEAVGLPYERAFAKYGSKLKRAYTHKALNRKLQGGAADIMKKAMVDCYEAGLFDDSNCGIPLLTVHDELDFEDYGALDNPAWEEMRRIMENGVETLVPIRIDEKKGANWADAD